MKLRSALLAAPILAAPILVSTVGAHAQPVDGLYVGAGAGYNYLQDVKLKRINTTFNNTDLPLSGQKLKGDGGGVGSVSLGYGFGNGFRVEIQGDYRQEHERFSSGTGGRSFVGGGDLQNYGGFVNGLYDFDLGFGFFYPYLGVGIGYEETRTQRLRLYGPANQTLGQEFNFSNQSSGSLAAQGIVGASFPIPDVPGLSLTAEYRFMAVVDEVRIDGTFIAAGVQYPASTKLGNQYNHSALLGIRYAFNVAPPPPPPAPAPVAAPAPAPARTYLVFFDWDRADLTARARQIVAEAAQNVTKVAVTRIEVSGHADLSGTPAYNQRLSLRRAETVAAELVKDGVARNEIDIQAFGDTRPLVPTARGVREPQNRRVEIVLK